MSETPTLDKYRLHPTGGYCTCYSNPHAPCETCRRCREFGERWDKLSPENRKKANREYEDAYPRTSNQDGR